MKRHVLILLLLPIMLFAQDDTTSAVNWQAITGPYLGQTPPGMEPELFAATVLSVDGVQHCVPTFSPDGREMYYANMKVEDNRPRSEIVFTREAHGHWSEPAVAPFSGEYIDQNPVFSSDGRRLYFSSTRPGGVGKKRNIWYVHKTRQGWSEPENLGSPPNSDLGVTQPTLTHDGTVYFVASYEGTQWNSAIYRSRMIDGKYSEPELLGEPFLTQHADVYPYIAPDESYILFGSSRPGAASTETDLYISFRDSSDTWSEPVHLDSAINNGNTVSFAAVTHDGKYLFFNRFDDGTDKFFWVDAAVLKRLHAHGVVSD